mmetsp:Transcript_28323/g.44177  ORF Transcript_28323/g.44177 Transcript_28323/m.44177 type:complete len:286 (-) Transcript_28323:206-1063(-)
MPDGFVIRWYNSDTGKFNGEPVFAEYGTASPDNNRWDRLMLYAAACSTSGSNPSLFICVKGMGNFLGQAGEDLKNVYFREVPLIRQTTGPKQLLQTYFLTKGDANCQWDRINVNPSDLTSLRPEIIKKTQLTEAAIQTQVLLDPDTLAEEAFEIESHDIENCIGLRRRTENAKQNNMPSDFTRISKLELTRTGAGSSDKNRIRFQVEGDWLHPPQSFEEELRQYIGVLQSMDIRVRWGPKGFECVATKLADAATGTDATSTSSAASSPSFSTTKFTGVPGAQTRR